MQMLALARTRVGRPNCFIDGDRVHQLLPHIINLQVIRFQLVPRLACQPHTVCQCASFDPDQQLHSQMIGCPLEGVKWPAAPSTRTPSAFLSV